MLVGLFLYFAFISFVLTLLFESNKIIQDGQLSIMKVIIIILLLIHITTVTLKMILAMKARGRG